MNVLISRIINMPTDIYEAYERLLQLVQLHIHMLKKLPIPCCAVLYF